MMVNNFSPCNSTTRDPETTTADEYFHKLANAGVLEYILSLVAQRRHLALVNKFFYAYVCEIDGKEDIYRVYLPKTSINDEELRNSVLCSKRMFSEIFIERVYFVNSSRGYLEWFNRTTFVFLVDLLKSHSEQITKLTLANSLLSDDQLIVLLCTLGNSKLTELNIINSVIMKEGASKYPNGLCFPYLKKINLTSTRFAEFPNSATVANEKNPCVSDNVRKLFQSFETSSPLTSFAGQVWAVMLINFNGAALQELSVQRGEPRNIRFYTLIDRCFNLQSLDIMDCYMMEDFYKLIHGLDRLHTLKINLDGAIMNRPLVELLALPNVKELHLKCGRSSKWICKALPDTHLVGTKSLHLDIGELQVSNVTLLHMITHQLTHLSIKTTNCLAAHIILLGDYVPTLESFSIVLMPGGIVERSFRIPIKNSRSLKELKLVSHTPNYSKGSEVAFLLKRLTSLEKVYIEGFDDIIDFHGAALDHHGDLRELTIINKNPRFYYHFDNTLQHLIADFGTKLKFMKISCTQCTYHNPQMFPVEQVFGNVHTFRRR